MSNSFTVDYAGISEASSLANSSKETLLDNLKEMNTKINELNCKDYFVGTIADDAMENWKKLNDGTEATINVLANLSSYLDKTNENYADTDKLAADILATSTTTGITLNSLSASTFANTTITEEQKKLVQSALDAGDNKKACWLFLKAKGLSDAAAAGVMGNIQAESNFVFDVNEHSNGAGYGLIQWTGSRRKSLEKAAQEAGVSVSDPLFQLEYLWKESLDPNTGYGKSLQKNGFYSTNSPVDAAVYFHDTVERSADSDSRVKNYRGGNAEVFANEYAGVTA